MAECGGGGSLQAGRALAWVTHVMNVCSNHTHHSWKIGGPFGFQAPLSGHSSPSRGPPACQLLNTPTRIWYFKKGSWGKFPSGPVVGTPCFHCHGCNSILGQGNKILTSFVVGPKEKKKKGSWALSNQRPWFPSPLGLKGQTRSLPMGLCWPQSVRGTDSGLLPRVSWGWRWWGCGQSARSRFPRLLRPEFLGRFTKMQDLVFVVNP